MENTIKIIPDNKPTIIWSETKRNGTEYRFSQLFQYNDGGRKDAGFKGIAEDCTTRSIAIITGKPYKEVYNNINLLSVNEKKCTVVKSSARNGVRKKTIRNYLLSQGFKWIPTMKIGSGCKIHLRSDELPNGKLLVAVSRHLTAVIDGVINDTYDCSRRGTRCVYGYFISD